ncbi:helix-turn-helix domain-containing protein [Streptomyces sp. BH-SS-21]|uniref:Helix-turn-helix domain-containing protein n=1 Tax=Streptomyces liliiviolaceus TaxID=2823109 RepID=A0A940Y3I2_9ACTN|nr:helix-turn-helix domain-containing protein [Streptomyces liliiviolaceus]
MRENGGSIRAGTDDEPGVNGNTGRRPRRADPPESGRHRPRRADRPVPERTGTRTAGRSVLEGAFELLTAMERTRGAGLTRLSSESGLPKATAHRLLEQLIGLGAVERSADGYRIGSRMFQLGNRWQPHPGLRATAAEPARRLAAVTGAAVGIAVLRHDQTLVLDWASGETGAYTALRSRSAWPWYTAAGKVLAASPEYRFPPSSVPASWPREGRAIRESGVAVDQGILTPGVCSVAASLYDASGTPVAALFAATAPAHRPERLADAVRRTSTAISARLGRGRLRPAG